MSSKRKNDNLPLSHYDQSALFRLYRWLRWERTQIIPLDASPERCRQRIEGFIGAKYLYSIKSQMTNNLCAFQVCVFTTPPKGIEQGFVIGQTVPEPDGKSMIILRAYPGIINSGCAVSITAISLVTVWVIARVMAFGGESLVATLFTGFLILALIALVWRHCFGGRDEALEMIARSFAPIAKQPLEKHKTEQQRILPIEEMVIPEIGSYEHKAQK